MSIGSYQGFQKNLAERGRAWLGLPVPLVAAHSCLVDAGPQHGDVGLLVRARPMASRLTTRGSLELGS